MDVVSVLVVYTLCFVLICIGLWIASQNEHSVIMKGINLLSNVCSYFVPNPVKNYCDWIIEKVLYTRNPLMQIIYIFLLLVGYTSYTITAYRYMNYTVHGNIPFLVLGVNLFLFISCSCMDPGVITKSNVEIFKRRSSYLYGIKNNAEINTCRTCLVEKLVRSKHCAICDHCVSRFDHHCTWLNNCIGQKNYKVFVVFLASLVVMIFASGFLVAMVFLHIIDKQKLYIATFTDHSGKMFQADLATVVSFLIGQYPVMSFLLLYLGFLFIALGCFLCFHIFLVLTNRTTNEIWSNKKTKRGDYTRTPGKRKGTEIIKAGKRKSLGESKKKLSPTTDSEFIRTDEKNCKHRTVFGVYSAGILSNIWEVIAG